MNFQTFDKIQILFNTTGACANKVYVKVKYANVPRDFPREPYCPAIKVFSESDIDGLYRLDISREANYGEKQYWDLLLDLIDACKEFDYKNRPVVPARLPHSFETSAMSLSNGLMKVDIELEKIWSSYNHFLITYKERTPYPNFDGMAKEQLDSFEALMQYVEKLKEYLQMSDPNYFTLIQEKINNPLIRDPKFRVCTKFVDRYTVNGLLTIYLNDILNLETKLTEIVSGKGPHRDWGAALN